MTDKAAIALAQTFEQLRAADYARLDRIGHVYLDYTGGGLYAESQVDAHMKLLDSNVFGNPHSTNPTSMAMTDLVEGARHFVLEFFNADPHEYVAIFTQNASGALKLVGEAYQFGPTSRYVLTFDNHNSVNGIREFARAKGATFEYVPVELPELRVNPATLDDALNRRDPRATNLFAYPAQSNFSGVQHPLEWVERAHDLGWDVLLDAAAFVPTNRLDLSVCQPEFVSMSFYKMFGYPTGIGALIAKRSALQRLRRPWFAGGTITFASVQGDRFYLAPGEAAFEDGTLNYLGIPAVEIGLRHIQRVGYEAIHAHVMALTGELLDELSRLRHANGQPLARIYGPTDTNMRGGTVTVNFYDARGTLIDHRVVEQRANAARISLRTGCFCNPGGNEMAQQLDEDEIVACVRKPGHETRMTIDDFRVCIDGKSTGAVRVSLGIASNRADVAAVVAFAASFCE